MPLPEAVPAASVRLANPIYGLVDVSRLGAPAVPLAVQADTSLASKFPLVIRLFMAVVSTLIALEPMVFWIWKDVAELAEFCRTTEPVLPTPNRIWPKPPP